MSYSRLYGTFVPGKPKSPRPPEIDTDLRRRDPTCFERVLPAPTDDDEPDEPFFNPRGDER